MEQNRPQAPRKKGVTLPDVPEGTERQKVTKQDILDAMTAEQDPAMFAGEGISDTNEIARPDDVAHNPYLYGRVLDEEGYYPGAKRKKKH